MRMRKIHTWFAIQVLAIVLPLAAFAAEGDDNPTGVAGVYNGNVQDGDSWDPQTGNQMRVVQDLDVPGAVGAYGLKWTRYFNSRATGSWTYSYKDYISIFILPCGFVTHRG